MKIQIQGVPTFFFHLTLEEVDALIKLALLHYDFTCKRAAGPDGVIALWKKDLLIAKEIREHQSADEEPYDLSLRGDHGDLDLVAKICEPSNMVGLPGDLKAVAAKVYMAFMAAMNVSNEKYNIWRHEFGFEPNRYQRIASDGEDHD